MSCTTSKQIAQWLEDLNSSDAIPTPRHINIKPIRLVIGKEGWPAARYTNVGYYRPNMDAVTRGDKKAGDVYYDERIYVVGLFGDCKKSRICYTLEGDKYEWYMSCYYQDKEKNIQIPHQPFGVNFILGQWTLDEAIDKYERFKYTRRQMFIRDC